MYTTPAVAGDVVYVGSCAGTFWAFDTQTGEVLWTYDIRDAWGTRVNFHGNPLITDSLIITGCDGSGGGHIFGFAGATGDVLWHHSDERGFPCDLAGWGSNVYAVTISDVLTCYDVNSGEVRWTFTGGPVRDSARWSGSPVIAGRRIFFGPRDGFVYALDVDSGNVIWEREMPAPVTTSIVVDASALMLGTKDGTMHRLDQGTGEILAEIALGARPRWRPLLVDHTLMVLVAGEREIVAVDDSLSGVLWRRQFDHQVMSDRPYLWEGQVLVGDSAGTLWSLSPEDGSVAWTVKLEGALRGIGSADSAIIVGTLGGMVYAVRVR
ncbi:MAG TPA: PQQ-binding-like beta-propeller repeat protein [Acidobacteriota bacterium]|nr:PQQ-binding-like beta-propeller repeat protein [Acidobacteriota bacterium]